MGTWEKTRSACARQGEGVAVLVPCYNEAPTIAKVVDDFRRVLPRATVYVYDNNSTCFCQLGSFTRGNKSFHIGH